MTLRAVEPTDIDFIYSMETAPEVWRESLGDAPVSRQMVWQYINDYKADIYADKQLRLIIDVDGNAAGIIDVSDYDPRNGHAMVGIAVDEPYRNKGIATEALKLMIALCRDTYGMHQLAAMVARDNEASIALFTHAGFKICGCLRSWRRHGKHYTDVLILQLLL